MLRELEPGAYINFMDYHSGDLGQSHPIIDHRTTLLATRKILAPTQKSTSGPPLTRYRSPSISREWMRRTRSTCPLAGKRS